MYSFIGIGAVIFLAVIGGVSEEPEIVKQPTEIVQPIKEEPKELITKPQSESEKEPEKQSKPESEKQPEPEKTEPIPEPVKEKLKPEPEPKPIIEEPKPEPKPAPKPAIICSSDIYNCGDFKTHAEAQKVFETCGGTGNDIHRLDRDKNGVACESLR